MERVVNQSIVDLVELCAKENADAIAVVDRIRQLTYAEVDARANQLAHLLIERGVGKETLVALCMRRSLEFVIAALGVLKAGGAYLPLDPDSPANRLHMLLSDSQTQLVITDSNSASQLPTGNWQTIVLDATSTAAARYPHSAPKVQIQAEDLAYVIYTSGSTGRPKGVEITHANLAALVRWHQQAFSISQNDHATFQASPGFDAAVWEIWPYLAAGACVHVIEDKVRTDAPALRDWIVANGITVSFLPTALAQQMLDLNWPAYAGLRLLLTGADVLRRHSRIGLPFKFVNNYGPTECTVVSTSGVVSAGAAGTELPTIGTPIDGVYAYIVDEQMQCVPDGMPGELLIGGVNVGRGYRNMPELTAQKFIANPFSETPNARVYRTGDLVRQLPNGEIAFVGRVDDQVKIRGYRIEPGEITAALNTHPDVFANVVVAKADPTGEQRLVAYVVAQRGSHLDASSLRHTLASQLPDYMVPSLFVQIESLPQSANGKVDRLALPLPTSENTLPEYVYEAPQSEVQEHLADIVARLLGVDRVGIDDNFFTRGGHSLLGAQLIANITDVFGVELSLLTVFDDPTVRGISAAIEQSILEKLENMSEDEAQRLLAANGD
jgi:amino acid adenylation domain-containing protein